MPEAPKTQNKTEKGEERKPEKRKGQNPGGAANKAKNHTKQGNRGKSQNPRKGQATRPGRTTQKPSEGTKTDQPPPNKTGTTEPRSVFGSSSDTSHTYTHGSSLPWVIH